MPPADIVVLTHAADRRFRRTKYLIHALSAEWEAMRLRVEVLRGTRSFVPAVVAIPHVDLSVRPAEYSAFARQYPRVVNRELTDISKAAYSPNLIGPESGETGPVIVKTDLNHGGTPELRLGALPRLRLLVENLRARRRASGSRRWRNVDVLDTSSYPIFSNVHDVPREVFENPRLVVERFLPEREHGLYAVRYCYVLGPREFTLRLVSEHPVVKAWRSLRCEQVEGTPEVALLRRRLGLDYGKIDFVVRDGKAVLLDVNSTPAYTALERFGLTGTVARHLAGGIRELDAAALSPSPGRGDGRAER